MAINVIKVGEVAGNIIFPVGGTTAVTDFAGMLVNFEPAGQPADECRWQFACVIGEAAAAREVIVDLAPFISSSDYVKSKTEPIFFSRETAVGVPLVFFRGRFFFPERAIYTEADKQEVILRIKKLTYDEEAAINRSAAVTARPSTPPAQAKSPRATPNRGHRSELVASWNRRLQYCGENVAKLWLVLAGLILLFAFPVSAIAASFLIGFAAARLIGGGALGMIAFLASAFLVGLFLAVYVWEPHVKALIYRAAGALNDALHRETNN